MDSENNRRKSQENTFIYCRKAFRQISLTGLKKESLWPMALVFLTGLYARAIEYNNFNLGYR